MSTARDWNIRPGDLRAVCRARHEFVHYLRTKHVGDDDCYDAGLVFGELVANAVKCARHSVDVELHEDGWSTLRVLDDGDCFDASSIGPRPLDAQSGRGLYIASQLTRNLSVATHERRCEVTAVLRIRS